MERIAQMGRSPVSTGMQLHSPACLSQAETTQLDRLIFRTMAYYPNQEMAKETVEEYRLELKGIAVDYSFVEVEQAVSTLRRTSEFFPHPAKVNQAIVERRQKQKEAERREWEAGAAERQWRESQPKAGEEPGEYCTMAEIYAEFKERKKAKGITGMEPVEQAGEMPL